MLNYLALAVIDAFPVGPKQDSGPCKGISVGSELGSRAHGFPQVWIGSGLAVLSAIIVFFMIDEVRSSSQTSRVLRQY